MSIEGFSHSFERTQEWQANEKIASLENLDNINATEKARNWRCVTLAETFDELHEA